MKFLHAMIRVKDLDKSLNFYQKLLGLNLINTLRLDDSTLYYLGNSENETQIELTVNDDIPENGYINGNSFGHFAFEIDSFDDFNKKIEKLGYKYLYEPFILESAGLKIAFLKDPDGNEIEVIEK